MSGPAEAFTIIDDADANLAVLASVLPQKEHA
jgi:hypothetical protein